MTIDEALKMLLLRVTCVDFVHDDNRHDWQAPTNEPFVEFMSGGLKGADDPAPALCATKEQAVETWLLALFAYEAKKPGVLYWRVKPEMEEYTIVRAGGAEEKRYAVYSRLLVSSRSVIRTVKSPVFK